MPNCVQMPVSIPFLGNSADYGVSSLSKGMTTQLATEDTITFTDKALKLANAKVDSTSSAGPTDRPIPTRELTATSNTPNFEKQTTLPDGQSVLELGDVDASASYFHLQGDNDLGYDGTCGLVACKDIADEFGENVSENYVVHYAVDHNLAVTDGKPSQQGGTTMQDQEEVLAGLNIPSHIESGNTLDGLGKEVEEGHGAIIEVNAGKLWNKPEFDSGNVANHAVAVTGVAADPVTGQAIGLWINDSGSGMCEQYVTATNPAIKQWMNNGGPTVVTNMEHS